MLNLFTIQNLNTYLPACDREVGKYTVLLILMSCVCLQTLKYRQHFGIIYLFWIQTTLCIIYLFWIQITLSYHLSLLDTDNTFVSFISSGYRQHFVSFISSGYRQHFGIIYIFWIQTTLCIIYIFWIQTTLCIIYLF